MRAPQLRALAAQLDRLRDDAVQELTRRQNGTGRWAEVAVRDKINVFDDLHAEAVRLCEGTARGAAAQHAPAGAAEVVRAAASLALAARRTLHLTTKGGIARNTIDDKAAGFRQCFFIYLMRVNILPYCRI